MHRLAIRDGWTTFIILALVVFTATWSVQLADWADGLQILTTITILGLLVGLVLSRFEQIPSVAAHGIAVLLGIVVVFHQMTVFLGDGLGGRREKLDYLWARWEQWYGTVSQGQRAEDLYLFVLLMAGLMWVLGYLSVWFVFRSRWVWMAALLPGIIVLLNLGYSRNVPVAIVLLYLFSAMLLMMRFSFAQKERTWRRSGIPYPEFLAFRGLWVASYLAVFVLVFGWVLPMSTQNQTAMAAWEQVNAPWQRVERTVGNWFGALRGPGSGGGLGGFASFSDSFELGGPLYLSEEPVLIVRSHAAPYLVAQRYNVFDGQEWSSDVSETFQQLEGEDVQPLSPYLRFDAGETFPVPASTSRNREEVSYSVEILRPRGAVVFTDQELVSTDVPTQVQTAWYTYENQELAVQEATQETTPPELWPLVQVLQAADFSPPETEEPVPTPDLQPTATATPESLLDEQYYDPEIEAEQERLSERQIETSYTVSDEGKVDVLTFSGQLPVYSDVEAVFAENGMGSGDQYEVTSLVTKASSDDLRSAGTEYPVEITSRYLQLPDQVSERTRELALGLASQHENNYDKANAIERWLRENIEYREDVRLPSDDVDLVDHFLFETRTGYCTYYASAMVEMLRINDIPSRVAVGFYPAALDAEVEGFLYRDLNAHAWVEAYFPEFGWIAFEPTSARSLITRQQVSNGDAALPESEFANGEGMMPYEEFEPYFEGVEGGDLGAAGDLSSEETSRASWAVRGGILMLLGLGATMAYLWLRGLSGMSPTSQLFAKVQRGASWGGLPVQSSMTPYEYATAVSKRVPGTERDVRLLADFYVRERYGRHVASQQEVSRARAAWLRVRGLLLRYVLFQRWRSGWRQDGGSDADW